MISVVKQNEALTGLKAGVSREIRRSNIHPQVKTPWFSAKSDKNFLIILFLLSFLVRALFFYFFLDKNKNYWVPSDSAEYDIVAQQIINGNGISNQYNQPSFFRVPGYSIFLAFIYKISEINVKNVLLLQIFLSSIIPLFVFCLSIIFFPANLLLAKLSALYSVFQLGFVLHSGLFMSESLFLLFFFLFLILFFSNFEFFFCSNKNDSFDWKKIFLVGIFLGISSLIRPVGHYALFLSIILLFFSNLSFSNKLKKSFLLFIGWLLIVFGWLLRNYLLAGSIFFHTMPGYHFLNYFAAEVDSIANKCSYSESKTKLLNEWLGLIEKEEKNKGQKLNDIQRGDLAQKLAIQTLQKNSSITIKHSFVNMLKTLFSLNSAYVLFLDSDVWPNYDSSTTLFDKIKRFLIPNVKHKFLILFIYFEIIFLFLTLIGFFGFCLVAFFDKNSFCNLLKVLPFIGLFVFLTLGSGVARLRLPIEPFLFIFAFDFWISLFKRIRLRVNKNIINPVRPELVEGSERP